MKLFRLLTILPSLVYGGATVHMGIIDEEIAAVLPLLIEEVPPKQVVFIEREGAAFENLPLGEHWDYIADSPPVLLTNESWLPKELSTTGLSIPFLPSKLQKTKNLTIYVFHPDVRTEDTAYVVRLPEMGLQPGLVGPTLLPVLRAIVSHEAKNNGSVSFSLLGSGGAVDNKLKPGDTGEVVASLYFGVDLVEIDKQQMFLPSIELKVDSTYRDSKDPLILFKGDATPMMTSVPAEQRKAYKKARVQLDSRIQEMLNSKEQIAGLRKQLDQIRSASGKEISISTSFFAGAPVKELGLALGIHNVNMEDSHVFAVINTLREEFPEMNIPALRLARQVEDPANISAKLNEKFLLHLTGDSYPPKDYPQYSRSAYVDAIVWGNLDRCNYKKLPLSGDWNFAWQHIRQDPEQAKHFYIFEVNGKKKILEPFFNEIAADMLPAMAGGSFLTPYMIDIEVHNQINKTPLTDALLASQLTLTNEKLAKEAKMLLATAAKLRVGNQNPDAIKDFRLQVLAILNEVDYLGGEKVPLIAMESLPDAYLALLNDPILKEHFVPSLLGPRDIQNQLSYREIPDALTQAIHSHMNDMKALTRISPDLIIPMSDELHHMAKEHLDLINDQIQLRMLALSQPDPSPADLYVLVNLVYKAQYPLPRVGFFVKNHRSLREGYLDVWTRQAKWFGNLTGFLNHLPYDYLVSDSSMVSDPDTKLVRAVRQILDEVHLQDSIFDRALYKSAIGPALMAQGTLHLKSIDWAENQTN